MSTEPSPRTPGHRRVTASGPAAPLRSRTGSGSGVWEALTWGFVLLGVAVRSVRYLLRFPLWGDECFLAASFVDGGLSDLVEPLAYGQVAPPGFLALELAAVELLGFSELSLRLVPFLCGVASVVLFRRLAARVTGGAPMALAVAIFAVSYYPVRHGAEVKPYSSDLFVAVGLLALAAAAAVRSPRRGAPVAALAVACALAPWFSYPSVFVAGGAGLFFAARARRGPRRALGALPLFGLTASAALFYLLFARRHMQAQEYMFELWAHTFPPLARPWRLPLWLADVHTAHLAAHPFGGKNGASLATTIACAAGVLVLWRSRRRAWLALLLLPFALSFAAAALRLYPYGGSTRWMLHLAPAVCLLAGIGAARLLRGRPSVPGRGKPRRAIGVALGLLAAFGVFQTARAWMKPYKNLHDLERREFARAFWPEAASGAELVCVATDLGLRFYEGPNDSGLPARYLCNQALFRPRAEPDLSRVAPGHPLRAVVYHPAGLELDERAFADWLDGMEEELHLAGREVHELERRHKHKGSRVDAVEVFTFTAPEPEENAEARAD